LIVANAAEAVVGDKGPQGPQGVQGKTGKTGATGAKGIRGDKGITGNQGKQGATGPKGGAKGDQGLQGDKGDAGTQIANGTHTGDTLVWNGSAWTPATKASSYSVPVVEDATGVYIGTFLQEEADYTFFGGVFEPLNPCSHFDQDGMVVIECTQEIYTLIFPTGYKIKLSDRGEVTSFHIAQTYDNSACTGSPTLVLDLNRINFIRNLVFKLVTYSRGNAWDLRYTGSEVYYFPSTPVPYTGPVYVKDYGNCYLNDPNTYTYYKPLINDPSVTGYDPTVINALQKPFRVSID
jgi:hypothetical protein